MDIVIKSLNTLWVVVLVSLVLGAGLPAVFGLGMRSLSAGRRVAADGVTVEGSPTVAGRIGAGLAFGVAGAAVVFGIVVIVWGNQIFKK